MIEIVLRGERSKEFRAVKQQLRQRRGVEPGDAEVLEFMVERYESTRRAGTSTRR